MQNQHLALGRLTRVKAILTDQGTRGMYEMAVMVNWRLKGRILQPRRCVESTGVMSHRCVRCIWGQAGHAAGGGRQPSWAPAAASAGAPAVARAADHADLLRVATAGGLQCLGGKGAGAHDHHALHPMEGRLSCASDEATRCCAQVPPCWSASAALPWRLPTSARHASTQEAHLARQVGVAHGAVDAVVLARHGHDALGERVGSRTEDSAGAASRGSV